MKQDELEQQLSRQPLRQMPAAWREEILSAAHDEQTSCHASRIIPGQLPSSIFYPRSFGRIPKPGPGWRRRGFLFSR